MHRETAGLQPHIHALSRRNNVSDLAENIPACLLYTSISGTVIHGRGIGKWIGAPTANLKLENRCDLPESGVYIAQILWNAKRYYGITHIGKRPTVDNQTDISIETHILNFDGDLYGQKIDVQLYQRLRRIQKFDDFSRLSEQIRCV